MDNYLTFIQRLLPSRRVLQRESVDLLKGNEIIVKRDLVYAEIDDQSLLLDLYLPGEVNGIIPVIVWIHGGDWRGYDWMRGSKNPCPIKRMVARGYAVASIDYRLSHIAKFPAQLEDCKAAIRWLRANARNYSLSDKAIGACGFSGGAMLAALLGSTGDREQFNGIGGNREQSSRVQAVVDYFGPTNLLNLDVFAKRNAIPNYVYHDSDDSPESLLVGGPIHENRKIVAQTSPITFVSKNNPPFLIIHGLMDAVVPFQQSEELFYALKNAGVETTLLFINGVGHGFNSLSADNIIDAFFDKHLKKIRHEKQSQLGKVIVYNDSEEYKTYKNKNIILDNLSGIVFKDWVEPLITVTGSVKYGTFHSTVLNCLVSYQIYLPPAYGEKPEKQFPVLYKLGGGNGNYGRWVVNESRDLDLAIRSGNIPEMLFVSVTRFDYRWSRRKKKRFEKMFIHDLMPHIESRYRTIKRGDARAIYGICAGAEFALRIAFENPGLFSAVQTSLMPYSAWHSKKDHHRTAKYILQKNLQRIKDSLSLHLVATKSDMFYNEMLDVDHELNSYGVNHQFILLEGVQHGETPNELLRLSDQFYINAVDKFSSYNRASNRKENKVYRDLIFSNEDGSDLKLDLYLPLSDNSSSSYPVVVWIHGSDWRGELWCEGSRQPCPAAYLSDHGYAVASIEYRFTKIEPFPAQFKDGIAALQWIQNNAKNYQLDSERVGLWGASGGAHLAALLGTTSGRGAIEYNGYKMVQSVKVKAVVDCFGPVDFTKWDAMHKSECHENRIFQDLDNSPLAMSLGGLPSEKIDLAKLLNPITYISDKTPPFLILHGAEDSVVPMGHSGLLHQALIKAGVNSNLKITNDAGHGLEVLNAWDEIQSFFDKNLKGKSHDEDFHLHHDVHVNSLGGISYNCFVDPISRAAAGTQYKTFWSEKINDEVSYLIYLPPSFNEDKTSRYPVIYWLHDKEQGPRDNFLYAHVFDQAIKAKEVSDVIIVFVNGKPDSGYRDSEKNGPIESMIIDDLIPHIDQNFPTIEDRKFRAIEGIGMGGEGAGRLGFKYPKLLGHVSIIGFQMDDNSNFEGDRIEDWLLKNNDFISENTNLRIVGIGDSQSSPGQFYLHDFMKKNNISHDWESAEDLKSDILNSYLSANFNIVEFFRRGKFI